MARITRDVDITRSVNFGFGIVLIVFAILFMFTKEAFTIRHGHQLDSMILTLLGLLSLWASITKIEGYVFLLNMALGLSLLVVTISTGILQMSGMETILTFRLDFTLPDFIFHVAIGMGFVINAIHWRSFRFHA